MQKKGKVLQSTGLWYRVMVEDGSVLQCRVPGKFRLKDLQLTNPVAVGDDVTIEVGKDGTGSINEVHERKNKITRQATHGRKGEQILVSNVDQGFVVQSLHQPDLKTGFIDRFLITAEAFGVEPLIIINKIDLGKDEDAPFLASILDLYESLGYAVLLSSIYDEESIELLAERIKDKTSVFIGPSGTGKTSLLNTIQPGLNKTTGEVSSFSNKGKHTTTFAELIPLEMGGFLADTPGIREFGLVHFQPEEISYWFPEMREVRSGCHYYNCTHLHEPGCAVMEAFHNKEIAASRYDSYINIVESLQFADKSTGSRKRNNS
jgi:ribosome biogenesis GTPase